MDDKINRDFRKTADMEHVSDMKLDVLARLRNEKITLAHVKYDDYDGSKIINDMKISFENGRNGFVDKDIEKEIRIMVGDLYLKISMIMYPEWGSAKGAHGRFGWNVRTDVIRNGHASGRCPMKSRLTGILALSVLTGRTR